MKGFQLLMWALIIVGAGLLFFSVRYPHHQLELAIAALAVWGVATLAERYHKKKNS